MCAGAGTCHKNEFFCMRKFSHKMESKREKKQQRLQFLAGECVAVVVECV